MCCVRVAPKRTARVNSVTFSPRRDTFVARPAIFRCTRPRPNSRMPDGMPTPNRIIPTTDNCRTLACGDWRRKSAATTVAVIWVTSFPTDATGENDNESTASASFTRTMPMRHCPHLSRESDHWVSLVERNSYLDKLG